MNPENFPDRTLDELVEDNDEVKWSEEDKKGAREDLEDFRSRMELAGASTFFARLLKDGKITFREYIELANHAKDYEDEWDIIL